MIGLAWGIGAIGTGSEKRMTGPTELDNLIIYIINNMDCVYLKEIGT